LQKTSAPIVEAPSSTAAPFEPVPRPRVLERIRRAARRRIVLVVAPAGFGKSVAVRQFLEADGIHHLRFSVRKEHATLVSFLRGLVGALEPIAPKASKSVAGAYEKASRGGKTVEHLAAWVTALLGGYSGTLVIDDLHLTIQDERIARLVAEIVSLSADCVKWVIATRTSLTLPFASWIAYGLMDDPIDESVLLLDIDEARQAARDSVPTMADEEVVRIFKTTHAWPAAYVFALRASRRNAYSEVATVEARETLYNYLADQVFDALSEEAKALLLETSVLSSIDVRVMEKASYANVRAILHYLRTTTAFVSVEAQGIYRYHDLFREFLEYRLRTLGVDIHRKTLQKMAYLLGQGGLFEQALDLLTQARDVVGIRELLKASGNEIFSNGSLELIERSLTGVPEADVDSDLLLLNARVKAAYGRDLEAITLFLRAQDSAKTPDALATVAWRYGSYLSRRQRFSDALATVARVPFESLGNTITSSLLMGQKAGLLASLGEIEGATKLLSEVMQRIGSIDDDSARATLYSYVSFVRLKSRQISEAKTMATNCLLTARRLGLYELATIACTQLYDIAIDEGDDASAGETLNAMLSSAELAGDAQMRSLALMNMYDRAGLRGDIDELERLSPAVAGLQQLDAQTWWESVLPTLALQRAWDANFSGAYRMLVASDVMSNVQDERRQALRLSEIAFYAAAGSTLSVGSERLLIAREAIGRLRKSDDFNTSRLVKARVLNALSLIILERFDEASKDLRGLESCERLFSASTLTLTRCARAFYVCAHSGNGKNELSDGIAALTASSLGGLGRLIKALQPREISGTTRLTETELSILKILGAGHTSREIASILGRSPLTVDTHVKAIVRKFGCVNRRDAVKFARAAGILEPLDLS
jgi:ATP/maltotriose-dependent transcriptional regulator MalT